jgi:hypothetical protein
MKFLTVYIGVYLSYPLIQREYNDDVTCCCAGAWDSSWSPRDLKEQIHSKRVVSNLSNQRGRKTMSKIREESITATNSICSQQILANGVVSWSRDGGCRKNRKEEVYLVGVGAVVVTRWWETTTEALPAAAPRAYAEVAGEGVVFPRPRWWTPNAFSLSFRCGSRYCWRQPYLAGLPQNVHKRTGSSPSPVQIYPISMSQILNYEIMGQQYDQLH